ncbi:MAG: hypothetical protein KGZ83_17460 [Sulfuricella sp.]|nr:hypothetical protein [Sulfuricella sp.]
MEMPPLNLNNTATSGTGPLLFDSSGWVINFDEPQHKKTKVAKVAESAADFLMLGVCVVALLVMGRKLGWV